MSRPNPSPAPALVRSDVERALAEDLGPGDVSAKLVPDRPCSARLEAREPCVLAGQAWFEACFRALDAGARFDWSCRDGDRVEAGTVPCRLHARSRAILSAERSALNFLQTLSATATRTAEFVAAVAGTGVVVLDTRKTLPGLRLAQKYAVRVGGGDNHRFGLYDAVMLKENHIAAAGSIDAAVARARQAHAGIPVIVEVENQAELAEAVAAQPDRILLDDFDLHALRAAVAYVAGRVALEVSGGVELDRIRAIAETGVDCISVGALTKHIRAIDLSLRIEAG